MQREKLRQSTLTELAITHNLTTANKLWRSIKRCFSFFFLITSILSVSACQEQKYKKEISFFDTAFCPTYLEKIKPDQIEIELVYAVEKGETVCSLELNHPLRHGDRVITHFFRNLTSLKQGHTLALYGLYGANGKSESVNWIKALNLVESRGSALIASAIALPIQTGENHPNFTETPIILASGQWGGRLKETAKLFPHEVVGKNQSLIIGSYFLDPDHQEAYSDQTLLYQERIDYSFAISDETKSDLNLSGSSYALAVATGRLMSLCEETLRNFSDLTQCLKDKSVSITTTSKQRLSQY